MPNPWWSWVLTLVGVIGLILAGRKLWVGWLIGLCVQALWVAYALVTRQYGFIASAVVYGAVYLSNTLAWRRKSPAEEN